MTTNRRTRSQVEKAFCAYLIDNARDEIVGVPMIVRMGKLDDEGQFELENPETIPLPAIVFSCPRAQDHEMGFGLMRCELHVIVMGSADGDDASDLQEARAGIVAEFFAEPNMETVLTAINPPPVTDPVTPDTRAVTDIRISGFYVVDEQGQEDERHWMDHYVYEVLACACDDVSL